MQRPIRASNRCTKYLRFGVKQCFPWEIKKLVTEKLRFREKVIRENIRGVFPDADDDRIRNMTRNMWYHLFLMGCEIAHAPRKIHDTNWRKHVFIRDKVRMTSYLIDYRPLVAVTGHFGNFEMAGYVTGLLGMPSYTVARKLDNEHLDRFLNGFRERNGQFILPKDGSAPAIQKVLDSGAILTILGDQHAGTKGCWIDFLGRPAACHKAIALFTLSGNAPKIVDPVVQRSNGRSDLRSSGSILVGAPSLEEKTRSQEKETRSSRVANFRLDGVQVAGSTGCWIGCSNRKRLNCCHFSYNFRRRERDLLQRSTTASSSLVPTRFLPHRSADVDRRSSPRRSHLKASHPVR